MAGRESRRRRVTPLLVGLAAGAVAWPAVRNEFSGFDDSYYVNDNVFLRSLNPSDLLALVTSPGGGAQFQPVTMLTYALNLALTGEAPAGLHAVDVLLFMLLCALVCATVLAILRDMPGLRLREQAWGGFLGGLVFAAHPLRVESYAWISDRKDLLAVSFALGAFLLARAGRRASRWELSAGAVLLLILGLGSKVTIAPVAVLIGLDAAVFDSGSRDLADRGRRALRACAIYVPTAAGLAVLWLWLQKTHDLLITGTATTSPPYVLRCLGHYVLKTAWPFELSAYYVPRGGVAGWAPPLVALALGGGVALVLALRSAHPKRIGYRFAIAWFLLGIAPVINVLPTWHYAADRYALFASIGVAIGVGVWTARASAAARGLVLHVVAGCLVVSQRQIPVWDGPKALWEGALVENPKNYVALAALAAALGPEERGRAVELLEEAVRAAPGYGHLAVGLAGLYHAQGRLEDEARVLEPYADDPRVLALRAERALESGEPERARGLVEGALKHAGGSPAWRSLQGRILDAQGDLPGALKAFERSFAVGPTAECAYAASSVAHRLGDAAKAREYLRLAELPGATWRTDLLASQIAGAGPARAARLRSAAARLPAGEGLGASAVAVGLAAAGLPGEGLALLRRHAETLDPSGRYNLARLECLVGDRRAGRRELSKAVAANPRLAERAKTDPAFQPE